MKKKKREDVTTLDIVSKLKLYLLEIDTIIPFTDDISFWEDRKKETSEIILMLLLREVKNK